MQAEMQRQFDHKSEDFTLERIIEFGFDQFAEQISDISGAATKELAIEQVSQLTPQKCFVLKLPLSFHSMARL